MFGGYFCRQLLVIAIVRSSNVIAIYFSIIYQMTIQYYRVSRLRRDVGDREIVNPTDCFSLGQKSLTPIT